MKRGALVLALCSAALPAWGQGELLKQVRESARAAGSFNDAREARFVAERDEQARFLRDAQSGVRQAEARVAAARRRWEAARLETAAIERRLEEARRELETLYDAARGAAVDLHDTALRSPVTVQYPDRMAALAPLAASALLPGPAELESLWRALQREMTESATTARFDATVIDPAGTRTETVTRIGGFTVFSGPEYFNLDAVGTSLVALPRPVSGRYREIGSDFSRAGAGHALAVIDPSHGSLLRADAMRPGLFDRLWSSGVGGYFIAGILLFAAVLVVLQSVWLRSRLIIDEQSIGVVAVTLIAFALIQWWVWTPRGSDASEEIIAMVDLVSDVEEPAEEPPPPELTPPPPPPEIPVSSAQTGMAGLPALAAPTVAPLLSNVTFPVKISGGGSLSGLGFGGFARGSGSGAGAEGYGRGAGFKGKQLIPLSTARPQMPEWACKQGIKGWVEAVFTVMPNGRVQDVKIIDANPRGVYEGAAIESISNWIYAETDKARTVKQKVPMDPADCAFNWR